MLRYFSFLLLLGLGLNQEISKDTEIELSNGKIVILNPDRTWEFKKIDIMDMGRDVLILHNGAEYLGTYKSKNEKEIKFHVDEMPNAQNLPLALIKSVTLSNGYSIYKASSDDAFKESLKNKKNPTDRTQKISKQTKLTYKDKKDIDVVKSMKGGSEFDIYETKSGATISLGDTLIIGKPSSLTTQVGFSGTETVFSFIYMGSLGLSQLSVLLDGKTMNLSASFQGDEIIVEKIYVDKHKSRKVLELPIVINTRDAKMEKSKILTAATQRTIIGIEKAISMGEIILKNAPLSREQAIKRLKESKELLELDIISQGEYDTLKDELTPIIRGQ